MSLCMCLNMGMCSSVGECHYSVIIIPKNIPFSVSSENSNVFQNNPIRSYLKALSSGF